MVDPVSSPVVSWIMTFGWTADLIVAGVIADKSRSTNNQVEQKTQHLHTDGDQEEDKGVLLVIRDQQLSEDAGQGDDHPSCACEVGIQRQM